MQPLGWYCFVSPVAIWVMIPRRHDATVPYKVTSVVQPVVQWLSSESTRRSEGSGMGSTATGTGQQLKALTATETALYMLYSTVQCMQQRVISTAVLWQFHNQFSLKKFKKSLLVPYSLISFDFTKLVEPLLCTPFTRYIHCNGCNFKIFTLTVNTGYKALDGADGADKVGSLPCSSRLYWEHQLGEKSLSVVDHWDAKCQLAPPHLGQPCQSPSQWQYVAACGSM